MGIEGNRWRGYGQREWKFQGSCFSLVEMGNGQRIFVMGAAIIEASFPKIRKAGYKITSPETTDYNCFAWVVGQVAQWWSPDLDSGYYWPTDVPRKLEVKSFVKLYERQGGYSPCSHSQLEKGFEKIAIYANATGDVTHVAKQTERGRWSSKLGDWEDIEHKTLPALEGESYGKVVQILKRAVI